MLEYSKTTVCSILSESIFRIPQGPGYIKCLNEAKISLLDTPLDFESILDRTFFIVVFSHHVVLSQGLLNRWTSQLDLGCTNGGLERIVSVPILPALLKVS